MGTPPLGIPGPILRLAGLRFTLNANHERQGKPATKHRSFGFASPLPKGCPFTRFGKILSEPVIKGAGLSLCGLAWRRSARPQRGHEEDGRQPCSLARTQPTQKGCVHRLLGNVHVRRRGLFVASGSWKRAGWLSGVFSLPAGTGSCAGWHQAWRSPPLGSGKAVSSCRAGPAPHR